LQIYDLPFCGYYSIFSLYYENVYRRGGIVRLISRKEIRCRKATDPFETTFTRSLKGKRGKMEEIEKPLASAAMNFIGE